MVAGTGAAAKAVAAARAVGVTTTGAAVQVAKEPLTHAENLATSATATSIVGVSAQVCLLALRGKETRNLYRKGTDNAVMAVGLSRGGRVVKEEVLEADDDLAGVLGGIGGLYYHRR